MGTLTDTLTYKNSDNKLVYELERLIDVEDIEGKDDLEFALTIHSTDMDDVIDIDFTREDLEILQKVISDALNNKV